MEKNRYRKNRNIKRGGIRESEIQGYRDMNFYIQREIEIEKQGNIIIKGEGERERRKDAQRQREKKEGLGRHED